MSKQKIAVVLFNLGGPDKLESVKPFLFNLFYDPAIIRLPNPFRWLIAKLISTLRNKTAQNIYKELGGRSPILDLTQYQAEELEKKLESDQFEYKAFINMRYWHPMTAEVIEQVKQYSPDEIILLPLYPHFSSTTTGSSIKEFKRLALKHPDLHPKIKTICCYPRDDNFLNAHVNSIEKDLEQINNIENYRLLFSAHGLPEKVIKDGDPYESQIHMTVQRIVEKLNIKNLDYKICYQSKVGPMKWLGPNTEEEIKLAGKQKKNLVIIPVAFVSEHSETLVELDIEYKEVAEHSEVHDYIRIPALGLSDYYIKSLANMVQNFVGNKHKNIVTSSELTRVCDKKFTDCPCNFNLYQVLD